MFSKRVGRATLPDTFDEALNAEKEMLSIASKLMSKENKILYVVKKEAPPNNRLKKRKIKKMQIWIVYNEL
jgi:hypothetical protein